jgi:hypothetical protein
MHICLKNGTFSYILQKVNTSSIFFANIYQSQFESNQVLKIEGTPYEHTRRITVQKYTLRRRAAIPFVVTEECGLNSSSKAPTYLTHVNTQIYRPTGQLI